MKNEKPFVLDFNEIGIKDVPVVGGKNAALGEMYSRLVPEGINVPGGFAVTAEAYRHILKTTGLDKNIKGILKGLDTRKIGELKKRGKEIRRLIMRAKMPREIREEIKSSYKNLSEKYGKNISVAVRSSATAEDLPGASFAGQQETYLNVSGASYVVEAVRRCMASLFTDRAISYRVHKGFSNSDVAISVGVQKMVRSDIASSGVAFTIDTESGFEKVIVINSIYGLGEMIVQGEVIPDEFVLFKPSLEGGFNPVISKKLGRKDIKLVYSTFGGTKRIKVGESARDKFSITDEEAVKLGEWCMKIERHFSKERGCFQPMDIEWAKDGTTGELFIVQARPETVAAARDKNTYTEYEIKEKGKMILAGISVGSKIGVGKVRIVKNARGVAEFKKGEVLVAPITDPDLRKTRQEN
ncbi:MAG: Phosphoenolpyruvate synthase [Candidatus Jorgensenbacteria bacterium GW2011_GWA2_45_9]|uniref:Phosphoenolpyruvate synthase n=1 Tax=Candidatus Jorgensenbacteria bacterium GW2011_GWA2_45_9 TaxID=1618663 RepID=A0A0G1N6F3_9BACT|nr:MAG: Phosphoenolpyruvate synthase [Candidatus Jorgensenbacteria bacterium GW2011_GWA2_45_9]